MKKTISFVLVLLFSATQLLAQVYIPDPGFKSVLVNNPSINTNSDAEIQFSEAQAFTGAINTLSAPSMLYDLTGIEAFVNLQELFCISNNTLSKLNLTQNVALKKLTCSSNIIDSLDLSQNILLERLVCANNGMDYLKLPSTATLTEILCGANDLPYIDNLSNCTGIVELNCSDNNITVLPLNGSNLVELNCSENLLSNLALNFPNLQELSCSYNPSIAKLDFTQAPMLSEINCSDCYLDSIDITTNSNVTVLSCMNNQLSYLNMANGNNTSINKLFICNNPKLTCVTVDDVNYSNANWPVPSIYYNGCQFCIDGNIVYSLLCQTTTPTNTKDINQSTLGSGVTVFPNPFYDAVTIKSSKPASNLKITDLTGRIIYTKENINTEQVINLENMPSGVYLLHFSNQLLPKKIIKR